MSDKPKITDEDLKAGAQNLAKVSKEELAKREEEKKKRAAELERVKAAYEAANK
jgi:hypothetical protein